MRFCQHPDCSNEIRPENKSGFCRQHYAPPVVGPKCKVCDKKLHHHGITGLCRKHWDESKRTSKYLIHSCSKCGKRVKRLFSENLCYTCYSSAVPKLHGPTFFRKIVNDLAAEFCVTPTDIIGGRRFNRLVYIRMVVAKIMSERGMSATRIGYYMGDRDHATILNLLHKDISGDARAQEIVARYRGLTAIQIEAGITNDMRSAA